MSDWLDDLAGDGFAAACILVSVVRTRGSCPREPGARMLVTAGTCGGTVGGGHLEYQAIEIARDMLASAGTPETPRLERFALGARLGQCCGGQVDLSFEYVPVSRPPWVAHLLEIRRSLQSAIIVTRFDSSSQRCTPATPRLTNQESTHSSSTHKRIVTAFVDVRPADDSGDVVSDVVNGEAACQVGNHSNSAAPSDDWRRAKARAQEMLSATSTPATCWEAPFLYEPFTPDGFDIRLFGAGHVGRALIDVLHPLPCAITWIDSRESPFPGATPDNVRTVQSDRPEDEVDDAPPGSLLIVMTHSHALDLAICERALKRTDIAWCGLIGSTSKRRRFEKRLLARGFESADLARLVCPIGVSGIGGKHPAEIAIAVAADILRVHQRRQVSASPVNQVA